MCGTSSVSSGSVTAMSRLSTWHNGRYATVRCGLALSVGYCTATSVSQQDAVAHQRALGLTGGARV